MGDLSLVGKEAVALALAIKKLETALHSAFSSKPETAAAIPCCLIVMIVQVVSVPENTYKLEIHLRKCRVP